MRGVLLLAVIALLTFFLASCTSETVFTMPYPSPTPCPSDDVDALRACTLAHPEVQEGLQDLAAVLALDDGPDRKPDDYYALIQVLIDCWGVDKTGRFAYMTPGEAEAFTTMAIGYIILAAQHMSDAPEDYYRTLEIAIDLCEQGAFD